MYVDQKNRAVQVFTCTAPQCDHRMNLVDGFVASILLVL